MHILGPLFLKGRFGDKVDWSKAKSILIIALIITNSLLGYVLFSNKINTDDTLTKEFIQDATKLLNSKDIKLNTEIPIIKPNLYGLTVEYEKNDPSTINKNFFQGKGTIVSKSEVLLEISSDTEQVSIVNKKLLIYESKSNNKDYNISSNEEAENLAMKFLNEKGYITSDMKLSFIKLVDGIYNIEYTKVFDDVYLESSFTNIQLSNNGVLKLERTWLNTKDIGTSPKYISSAPKSILALISMEEVYGKTIKDISLCYYFDPEKHNYDYMEDLVEAKQGSTIPAWRIQFEDGYKVFIDDF